MKASEEKSSDLQSCKSNGVFTHLLAPTSEPRTKQKYMFKAIGNWLVKKYEDVSIKAVLILIPTALLVVAYSYSVTKLSDYIYQSMTVPFLK